MDGLCNSHLSPRIYIYRKGDRANRQLFLISRRKAIIGPLYFLRLNTVTLSMVFFDILITMMANGTYLQPSLASRSYSNHCAPCTGTSPISSKCTGCTFLCGRSVKECAKSLRKTHMSVTRK